MHVANVEGMRRAVAALATPPGYVLTDGFPVRGFGRPGARRAEGRPGRRRASPRRRVLAKVTRDRIMVELHAELPQYGFDAHKGYCTPVHDARARGARAQPGAPVLVRQRRAPLWDG